MQVFFIFHGKAPLPRHRHASMPGLRTHFFRPGESGRIRRIERVNQTVCKPGSVRRRSERDGHSSGTLIAERLVRSTRTTHLGNPMGLLRDHAVPIRSCSRRGLPCRFHCWTRGALLPHLFTLAPVRERYVFCGAFPGVAPAGRYPASCFHGARTFLRDKRGDHPTV